MIPRSHDAFGRGCLSAALSLLISLPAALCTVAAERPTSTVPEVGIRQRVPQLQALVGARIVTQPGKVIAQGTLLIDGGVIRAVAESVEIPPHATTLEMQGRTIYPGLINPYSEITVSTDPSPAAHWNKHVRPERATILDWQRNDSADKPYREAGFALRLIAPHHGILKGTSAVVTTSDLPAQDSVPAPHVAQHVRLTVPPGGNRSEYPRSPMGAVALARQCFLDASWYRQSWRAYAKDPQVPRPETNLGLQALSLAITNDELFIFDAADEQYALRADRFAKEFGLRMALRGSGREYQRLAAIADCQRTVIVPVNFPKPPNVASVEATQEATLAELMHWRLAPENPQRLIDAGVDIALTPYGLKDLKTFRSRVRQAVNRGLDPTAALHACTVAPAELLKISDKAGTLEVGKAAHLMITDGDWLEEKTKVVETWVDGKRFQFEPQPVDRLQGTWELTLRNAAAGRQQLYLTIKEQDGKLSGHVSTTQPQSGGGEENDKSAVNNPGTDGPQDVPSGGDPVAKNTDDESSPGVASAELPGSEKLQQLSHSYGRLTASFAAKIWDEPQGTVRLTATVVGKHPATLLGNLLDENGQSIAFTAQRLESAEPEGAPAEDEKAAANDADSTDGADESGDAESAAPEQIVVNYPLGAFGRPDEEPHLPRAVVIENATIWTCNEQGEILETASVLFRDGRILQVGADLQVPEGAERIDATGKHLTPGIIDCHSHMATDGGVNEGTQAITAEVRIGDFIDATDISIYRQLAGGVTCANILHGSANPIGGQNQVIKLRWGRLPEAMKFETAPPGIKFALGENVKQSNWGDEFRTRYPQTRMGVEQIIRDAFHAAKAYAEQWQRWEKEKRGIPPRRDLELEAILEIVNGQRWIHCHSYRQDEILALMRTLESFDIRIGTFQHILEGYKVAPEMAAHGAMGSAFSDWWGYKFEVIDAIPYNGALMHRAGVVVSFNSDDQQLARHLNHEAAKALKYGQLPAADALKFVTLNPAKQLRIDGQVGSIEPGKHADLVLWSGPPLSLISRCEQTWVDGFCYFDREHDLRLRSEQAELRERLVRLILDSGETMREPGEKENLLRDLWPRYDEYCGHGHVHGHQHGAAQ